LVHQTDPPSAPSPLSLLSDFDRFKSYENDPRIPKRYAEFFRHFHRSEFFIDCRDVNPVDFFNPSPQSGESKFWIKIIEEEMKNSASLSPLEHFPLTAYLSDWKLPFTCLRYISCNFFDSVAIMSQNLSLNAFTYLNVSLLHFLSQGRMGSCTLLL
jgi:acyl-CoA thioesterase